MADRCVGVKGIVKDIFDSKLEQAALDQIEETFKAQIKKAKGLTFDAKCKDGWMLTATVVSLKVDDADAPSALEIKITIGGVPLFGTADGFNASGNRKVGGINAKKMEDEVKSIVDGSFEALLTKQVIPQMTK